MGAFPQKGENLANDFVAPSQILPFGGADKPDFGYYQKVLEHYERSVQKQR